MSKKVTTELFIIKAKKVNGDKYDYSKVNYIDAKTKIIITCPEHGNFEITPTNHLSKKGCSRCSGNFNLTTDEFITKSKEIHGEHFDYSLVQYKGIYKKVSIICPIHGEIKQTPRQHLRGHGCNKCAHEKLSKLKLSTTEDFIKKAKIIHGDKYDYSKVNYRGAKPKVLIVCPKCGEFEQSPSNHLTGFGCNKCTGRYKTTEQFIAEVKKKHGDKYDYSKTQYIDSKTRLIITCPIHGDFLQRATDHYRSGCPQCGGTMPSNKDEFIEKARKVHGNKYDYSKVVYSNNRNKVTIICPTHGEFKQQPTKHITDQTGCPKCFGHGFTYLSFNDAKKIVQSIGLKTSKEYKEWWLKNKDYCHQIGIPYAPYKFYH